VVIALRVRNIQGRAYPDTTISSQDKITTGGARRVQPASIAQVILILCGPM
jgi:hypothetical protein